ncbi:MAG: cytochrome c, class I [Alphaproteobacteria bacterium]|nr:MAG: cytochrome c, class I [Alphaproteobacteria bacterium]
MQMGTASHADTLHDTRIAQATTTAPAPAARPKPTVKKPSAANTFNRLLKRPATAPHAAPAEDGIHDPDNPGTHLLQWPSEAFQGFPPARGGNRVDWVKALEEGLIAPRYELDDPTAEAFTMDLTIVREVKGSMPDVVYPHLPHTQWLDCTNCHDDIFIPEKGKNQISMAAILLGQKCGVCHGKVAFPVTDCRRCHSKPKTEEQLRALAKRSARSREAAGTKGQ